MTCTNDRWESVRGSNQRLGLSLTTVVDNPYFRFPLSKSIFYHGYNFSAIRIVESVSIHWRLGWSIICYAFLLSDINSEMEASAGKVYHLCYLSWYKKHARGKYWNSPLSSFSDQWFSSSTLPVLSNSHILCWRPLRARVVRGIFSLDRFPSTQYREDDSNPFLSLECDDFTRGRSVAVGFKAHARNFQIPWNITRRWTCRGSRNRGNWCNR